MQTDYDFKQLSINCVLLAGLTYKTDVRKVHQLIHVFVQGETAEMWISPKEKKQDFRLDCLSLLARYGGEVNNFLQIKEVETLRTLLIYKNDRVVSFKKFLTNMQTMFTRLSENGEILNNLQKIRLIFQKVQKPILTQIKA